MNNLDTKSVHLPADYREIFQGEYHGRTYSPQKASRPSIESPLLRCITIRCAMIYVDNNYDEALKYQPMQTGLSSP